ncbi:SMR family transporter [Cohnella faecalis]|uniref:SMR family transporter n=1 Tax=Cohnella faecalis TaxID=2315694 RepID=UPI001F29CD50|nr:SMR family transporter [Cohnella faecalis]
MGYLIIAGMLEVVGVIGIKRTAVKKQLDEQPAVDRRLRDQLQFLLQALDEIALSTAYAVWTGIGSVAGRGGGDAVLQRVEKQAANAFASPE